VRGYEVAQRPRRTAARSTPYYGTVSYRYLDPGRSFLFTRLGRTGRFARPGRGRCLLVSGRAQFTTINTDNSRPVSGRGSLASRPPPENRERAWAVTNQVYVPCGCSRLCESVVTPTWHMAVS